MGTCFDSKDIDIFSIPVDDAKQKSLPNIFREAFSVNQAANQLLFLSIR
jgi:hypothetical protein